MDMSRTVAYMRLKCWVGDCDVRRIANNGRPTSTKHVPDLRDILGLISMVSEKRLLLSGNVHLGKRPGRVAVEQGVSDRDVDLVRRRVDESGIVSRPKSGDEQTEPGDVTAKGLRSIPADGVQRTLGELAPVCRWLGLDQATEEPSERPEQKVPEPQVGSMIVVSASPNVAIAGSRVRSRMNSSTNTGVCSSA